MVLINIKIFNKFENLVILLSEQKFGDFGGGDYIYPIQLKILYLKKEISIKILKRVYKIF